MEGLKLLNLNFYSVWIAVMQIVQQTPTYLKLQENRLTAQLWKIAVGLPFVLSGLASMVFLGERATLTCDRPLPLETQCHIATQTLLTTTRTPLPPLQGAEVETRSNGQGNTYRVSLLTRTQPIPLTQGWSPDQQAQQMQADVINVFLENPSQPTLQLEQDARWFAYPLGALFVGLGGLLMVTGWRQGEPDYCTFDKRSRRICWSRALGGRSPEKRAFKIQDVEEVRVFRGKGEEGDRPYTTRLVLQSGEMLPLLTSHTQEQPLHLASTINRFLELQPRPKQP